jgi:hypothetical protein
MVVKASPFLPTFLRAASSDSRPVSLTFSDVSDTNILSTSSFIYDPPNSPLKSTQQLNVDWSKFENHTFFMSAEAKVNLAFEQVINGYPFDGTRREVEAFFDALTGFDKWVFDQFPKYHGQLAFTGSYISVADAAGALYPELSKTKSGVSVLNPKDTSMSIEMLLYVPNSSNGTQVVVQKSSGSSQGFVFYLEPTGSTSLVNAAFGVASGSQSMFIDTTIEKGTFNHMCLVFGREDDSYLEMFVNEVSVGRAKNSSALNDMDIDGSPLTIGSGSAMTIGTHSVVPNETLSGTLDELRIFHSVRSLTQQKLFAEKSIFATDDLKLYYRFNEPPPPLSSDDTVNAVVIDSSGNSLHSVITGFTASLRQASTLAYERDETVPVLFPAHLGVVAFNVDLLSSASDYDRSNPNLITKLVPPHYLLEGAAFEGMKEPEGTANDAFGGDGIAGTGKMGSVQVMLSLLYIWARFFDEIKLFVDAFGSVRNVEYDVNKSAPDNFLHDIVRLYGFHLPPLFNDSTIEQYIRAENINQDIGTSVQTLKHVQNELLRRVVINLPDVIKSKGTQHSIKSFLRAVGIDPDNSVRIREHGGPTERNLSYSRENRLETGTMVEFTSGCLALTPILSASRVEPGVPNIAGTFVDVENYPPIGISDTQSDGLLTSGSWTVESIVKFTPKHVALMKNAAQSLVRMCVTGTLSGILPGIVANLTAVSSSTDPTLTLWVRPGIIGGDPMLALSMPVPGNALFNGDRWNVSFGRQRNDMIGSRVSSSYFLRLASQNNGDITYYATTSSFFESTQANVDAFTFVSVPSITGNVLAIGSGQQIPSGSSGSGFFFLNDTDVAPDEARTTDLVGLVSNLRFWSRALDDVEWTEHVRNFRSDGVHDPLVNYNFEHTASGSFGRLRLDALTKQEQRQADATGSLEFLDFSLNDMHMLGTGFPTGSDVVRGEIFDVSFISPYFDEAVTSEKVRVRSYQDQALVDATPWAQEAPVYELVKSEAPTDDVRFTIDFSLIDALNRDIITMFSTLDALDNALGAPELAFSPDYPDIDNLRTIYFNRIHDKLNFKAFFEFFRWFDMSIGTFIEQLVPRKTAYNGTNFVVESHMFERHKLEYQTSDMYLSEQNRQRFTARLLLQEIAGTARKY